MVRGGGNRIDLIGGPSPEENRGLVFDCLVKRIKSSRATEDPGGTGNPPD